MQPLAQDHPFRRHADVFAKQLVPVPLASPVPVDDVVHFQDRSIGEDGIHEAVDGGAVDVQPRHLHARGWMLRQIGAELGAHWSTLIDQFHRAGLVAPVAMIKKALKLKDSGYGGHPGRVQDEHLGIRNGSPSTSD